MSTSMQFFAAITALAGIHAYAADALPPTPHTLLGSAMPAMPSHQLQIIGLGRAFQAEDPENRRFFMILSNCDAQVLEGTGALQGIEILTYADPAQEKHDCQRRRRSVTIGDENFLPRCKSHQRSILQRFAALWPGFDYWWLTRHLLQPHCESLLQDLYIVRRLHEIKPAAMLADFSGVCPAVLADWLRIPRIDLSPSTLLDPILANRYNFSAPPELVPMYGSGYRPDDLVADSWALRMNAGIASTAGRVDKWIHSRAGDALRRRHGITWRDTTAAASDAALVLVNADETIDWPRPMLPPHVKMVGPLLARPANAHNVPEDIRRRVGSAKKWGKKAVYVSFGSVFTGVLTQTQLFGMFRSMEDLENEAIFLWKLSQEELPPGITLEEIHVPCNVMLLTASWVPQNDLMGSGHIDVAILHGGNNGFYESLWHGVPVVIIPFAGDQVDNAAKAVHHSVGVQVKRINLGDAPLLAAAVRQVLYQNNFKHTARGISGMLKERAVKEGLPLERAAKFVDRALMSVGVLPASRDS